MKTTTERILQYAAIIALLYMAFEIYHDIKALKATNDRLEQTIDDLDNKMWFYMGGNQGPWMPPN